MWWAYTTELTLRRNGALIVRFLARVVTIRLPLLMVGGASVSRLVVAPVRPVP